MRGVWRHLAVAMSVLVAGISLQVLHSPPAQAAVALTCDPNLIFNMDIEGDIYSLDPATRANTFLGTLDNGTTEVNALGVTPGAAGTGAVLAYAARQANGTTVYRSDGANFDVPGVTGLTIVMGAVDPSNGIYYYAGFGNIGGSRYLRILAFDPSTQQGLGEVARLPEPYSATTAGDFAFDLSGNLYVLVGRTGTSELDRIDVAELPSTTQTTPPIVTGTQITTFSTPSGGYWNGIAFGISGYLYAQYTVQTGTNYQAYLAAINPNSPGTVAGQLQTFEAGYPHRNPDDLAGCSTPGTLTVRKDLTRAASADQFTMTITGYNTELASATTTGTADGLQSDVAGPVPGRPGTVYTVSESLSDASATSLEAYDAPTIACVDTNDNTPVATVATADPRTFTLEFPTPEGAEGANVVCTFTNAPAPPILTLRKEIGGPGRISSTDQFTVQIQRNGTSVGTGNPTTAGTGAEVAPGTGTQTVSPAEAGATYHLSEVMAPGSTSTLDTYQQIIQCTDLNDVQTGLPDRSFTASNETIPVTPMAGSHLDCVITNAPRVPLLGLHKMLGSHRVRESDQFRVAIRVGSPDGPELPPVAGHDPTTEGTSSTVEPDTGTTGFPEVTPGTEYFLTETAAGTPPTDLGLYTKTVTCVDEDGIQPADTLPSGVPLSENPSVTPVVGAWISCTITNTGIPPTLALGKALGGARVNAGDQFRMQILADDQETVLDAATTSGTGDAVIGGTAMIDPARAGHSYFVDEVHAGTTDLRQYESHLTCTDANGVQTDLPADTLVLGPFEVTPELGAAITCTITNTPTPPELSLDKALGSARANPGDQFTVQILAGGEVVGDTARATTAGTGDTVEPGTGVTAVSPAVARNTYTLTEQAAGTTDLADYARTIDCQDLAEVQTGLPSGPFAGSVAVTPVAGASISCTITNTVRPPAPPPPSTPVVRTATSHRRVAPGRPFRDRIHVSRLTGAQGATAVARLYGPFTSRAAATCRAGLAVRTFTQRVHNGWNRTPIVRIRVPGVYTWRVALRANAANHAATHRCGQAVETTVVAKRPYVAPIINGGFSGTVRSSEFARRLPVTIRMPSVGLSAPVRSEGVVRGRMRLPGRVADVGWLRKSAGVGDKIGTVVVAGHVSDRHDRPGAMYHLARARAGQAITVAQGRSKARFKVVGKKVFDRRHRLPQRYFATTGPHRLVLVSCTDKVVYASGHFHYTRYVVVLAKRVRR